jgi:hypothetical protein
MRCQSNAIGRPEGRRRCCVSLLLLLSHLFAAGPN